MGRDSAEWGANVRASRAASMAPKYETFEGAAREKLKAAGGRESTRYRGLASRDRAARRRFAPSRRSTTRARKRRGTAWTPDPLWASHWIYREIGRAPGRERGQVTVD